MADIELSDNPNVDTGYVTVGDKKHKTQLTAQLDASNIELSDSPNVDTGFVIRNGKKHKVKLVASLYGGGGGGTGAVDSVNGKTGTVVLSGADINATLTAGNVSQTGTITEHLQTLKNDDKEKGDAIQLIQELIPENASGKNHLVTKEDLPSGEGADNNGLEGDYCSRYGIVDETTSGLPVQGTGNQVIIPAGLVLDVPGSPGLTTVISKIIHDLTATTNCEIWLANGTAIEVLKMFWSETEPEDGTEGFAGWWNGSEMKFKSNDTGNVWRAANAVRVAKCIFTDGNLTRLCFTGCRVLNKQEFASKDSVGFAPVARLTYAHPHVVCVPGGNSGGPNQKPRLITLLSDYYVEEWINECIPTWARIVKYMASQANSFNTPLTTTNKGATMADLHNSVPVPPAEEGTYTLKATVAADGTVTTNWVKDA